MRFGILGQVEVRPGDGSDVAVGGPRVRALLALLLLDAGRLVTAERLIDGLYGEEPPQGAANALQSQVSRLRRGLGDAGLVEGHPAGYRLVVERDDVDVHRFERLAREGRQALGAGRHAEAAELLKEALGLWRGPALADLNAPFVEGQAARLDEAKAAAMEDHAEAALALGQYAGALPGLQELVAAHPLRERPRGLLMRALYGGGRQAEALTAYEDARRILAEELGADPSAELAEVHLAILRGDPGLTAPAAAPPVVSNLPAQLTSFVGREEELRRVGKLLAEARLVTLLGPGGAGKTRLSIEVGQREQGEVCFVDLSPLGDGRELPEALLAALGLREHGLQAGPESPGDPATRLVAALAERRLLLILDNCEHVVDDAARLTHRLLAACPGLRVLATSREALGITGEKLRPLPPLPLPPAGSPAAEVLGYPAVRLFADRASAVRPDFAVTGANLAAVLRICGALDGLPLAIELAAARLRTLPVEEVAARLDDRFRLLSRGDRTAAPRHQTLRAVVEWSWDLLGADEQSLARRLTVFSGGITLDAAERVCGLPVDEVDELLAGLTDKSLLQADGGRYRMLETVRAFCAERLADAGEEERLRRAHAEYFLDLAETADPHLRLADQLDWMARLTTEHGNLRAALRWTVATDPVTGLRLMGALSWYGWLRGLRSEFGAIASDLLRTFGTEPPDGMTEEYVMCVVNARAAGALGDDIDAYVRTAEAIMDGLTGPPRRPGGLVLWAMVNPIPTASDMDARRGLLQMGPDPWLAALDRFSFAYHRLFLGRVEAAEAEFEAAAKGFRVLGDRWGIANTLDAQSQLAEMKGDRAAALALVEEALVLIGQLGALEDQGDLLCRRANILLLGGSVAGARRDYERAAELATRAGAPQKTQLARLGLADVARVDGDAATARRLYGELLAEPRIDWGWGGDTQERAHIGLGRLDFTAGDVAGARSRFLRGLVLRGDDPLSRAAGDALECLAMVAVSERDGERAALLLGAAREVSSATSANSPDIARLVADARDLLGDEAYDAAHARGAAMPPAEVLTIAGG